jgi:hypothetical protein
MYGTLYFIAASDNRVVGKGVAPPARGIYHQANLTVKHDVKDVRPSFVYLRTVSHATRRRERSGGPLVARIVNRERRRSSNLHGLGGLRFLLGKAYQHLARAVSG